MKFFAAFFAAVPALVNALATPTRTTFSPRALSFNPPRSETHPIRRDLVYAPAPAPRELTNGERLARGLPLKRPRFAMRKEAKRTTQSATTYNGFVFCEGGGVSGYISATLNDFGEYSLQPILDGGALEVKFVTSDGSTSFEMTALNPHSGSYPFVGAGTGFGNKDPQDQLGEGSRNYLYMVGTNGNMNSFQAATDNPSKSESVIWNLDPASSRLTTSWVNPDQKRVGTVLFYANDSNQCLGMSGDLQVMNSELGTDYPAVSCRYVSS